MKPPKETNGDYIARLAETACEAPPPPWTVRHSFYAGHITEVGFDLDEDLVLVVTPDGRGVFDCATGEKLCRDRSSLTKSWYRPERLEADGVGPLAGRCIRLAGECGGGLCLASREGWTVERVCVDWPREVFLLNEPTGAWSNENMDYMTGSGCTKIADSRDFAGSCVAFGFSYTGRSLILVARPDIHVFHRSD